jgi:hypothetical protein
MATLRALVGAGSVLAFLGFVVFAPLGWALVVYTAGTASTAQVKAHHARADGHTAEIIKRR